MTEGKDNHDDECPLCAAAEPTDIGRLFDAVNASLMGCKLSAYENFSTMTVANGRLDLRKLLALLLREELYIRPDGRLEKTPDLPRR